MAADTVPAEQPARSLALRTLAELVVPDPGRDGAAAVMRALQLAGVRPASVMAADIALPTPPASPSDQATDPAAADPGRPAADPPLTRQLAVATSTGPRDMRHEAPQSQPTATSAEFSSAAERSAREHLADQVFKPQQLADYDRVVPLPLAAGQLPTPARLAVATRSAGHGGANATFLRVDAELASLGPVSVRMSGVEGGPLAITILANPAAGRRLADDLPDLVADLRKLGIEAGVRVASEEPGHG